jgi:hypothetical protein
LLDAQVEVSVTVLSFESADVIVGVGIIAFSVYFLRRRPIRIPVPLLLGLFVVWFVIHVLEWYLDPKGSHAGGPFLPIALGVIVVWYLRQSLGNAMVVNVEVEDVERAIADALRAKGVAFTQAPRMITLPTVHGSIEIAYYMFARQVNIKIKADTGKQALEEVVDTALKGLERTVWKGTPMFGLLNLAFGIIVIVWALLI